MIEIHLLDNFVGPLQALARLSHDGQHAPYDVVRESLGGQDPVQHHRCLNGRGDAWIGRGGDLPRGEIRIACHQLPESLGPNRDHPGIASVCGLRNDGKRIARTNKRRVDAAVPQRRYRLSDREVASVHVLERQAVHLEDLARHLLGPTARRSDRYPQVLQVRNQPRFILGRDKDVDEAGIERRHDPEILHRLAEFRAAEIRVVDRAARGKRQVDLSCRDADHVLDCAARDFSCIGACGVGQRQESGEGSAEGMVDSARASGSDADEGDGGEAVTAARRDQRYDSDSQPATRRSTPFRALQLDTIPRPQFRWTAPATPQETITARSEISNPPRTRSRRE